MFPGMQKKPQHGFMLQGYHFLTHSPVISPKEKLLEVQFDGRNNLLVSCVLLLSSLVSCCLNLVLTIRKKNNLLFI